MHILERFTIPRRRGEKRKVVDALITVVSLFQIGHVELG